MPTSIATWSRNCEIISLVCLAISAFFISVSTSIMTIFFFLAPLFFWLRENPYENWQLVKNHPLTYWVLALFLLLLLGSTYSHAHFKDIFSTIYKYGKFAALPFFLPLFQKNTFRKTALYAFFFGALFLVLMSFFKSIGWIIFNYSFDPNCAFHDHIQTSLEVALVCFGLGHAYLDTSSIYKKIFIVSCVLFLSFYLFAYNTGRSGIIMYFLLFCLLSYQRFSTKTLVFSILGIMAIATTLFFVSSNFHNLIITAINHVLNYHGHLDSENATSEGLRLSFWKHSWILFLQNPIIGGGTGSFAMLYQQFASSAPPTVNPHNEYLYMMVQFGIIGLIFIVAWFGFLIWLTRYLDQSMKYLAQGFLLSYIIGCLFNSWLLDSVMGYIFTLFVALIFARIRIEQVNPIKLSLVRCNDMRSIE